MFGDLVTDINNNRETSSSILDGVREYFGLLPQQKQNIQIDAQEISYSHDMVIYNSSMQELMRIRGNYFFDLSCNKDDGVTPDGNRITKGITINNHKISVSNVSFTPKEMDTQNIPNNAIEKTLSKARNFVGVLAPQGTPILSKGVSYLMSVYSVGQGVRDLIAQANEIKDLFSNKQVTSQQIQTKLENILLSEQNGSFIITYAGKAYNKMACVSLHTEENLTSLINVSMDFEYSPTHKTTFSYKNVKGWNTALQKSEQIATTKPAQTFLKEGVDIIMSLMKDGY